MRGGYARAVPRRLLLVAVALSFAAVSPAWASDFVGAETCAACHEAEYRQWRGSPHARALTRLSKTQQRDRICRSCHTTDPGSDDPKLAGVQCESCHGAGSLYAPKHVMKDPELAKLFGLEKVTEKTCVACHKSDGAAVTPFDFATKLELVKHGTKKKSASSGSAGSAAPKTAQRQ